MSFANQVAIAEGVLLQGLNAGHEVGHINVGIAFALKLGIFRDPDPLLATIDPDAYRTITTKPQFLFFELVTSN